MREFGLAALARAVYEVSFSEMYAPYSHAMAVSHAANGAEILLKARIAQEHPLLIFETLPKSNTTKGKLTVAELLKHGRTIQYSELPERVWATAAIRIPRLAEFKEFGRLRNKIVHFAVPEKDYSKEVLKFAFEVIDPLVQLFWDDSILNYIDEWDEVTVSEGYFAEQLKFHNLKLNKKTRTLLKQLTQYPQCQKTFKKSPSSS